MVRAGEGGGNRYSRRPLDEVKAELQRIKAGSIDGGGMGLGGSRL